MTDHEIPQSATQILAGATPEQVRWVVARLGTTTDQDAARDAGIHRTTVSKWENKPQLDEAVRILLLDAAESARQILLTAAPDAARTLTDSLKDKRQRVQAANSILDRVGIASESKVDVTSGGKRIDIREVIVERPRATNE